MTAAIVLVRSGTVPPVDVAPVVAPAATGVDRVEGGGGSDCRPTTTPPPSTLPANVQSYDNAHLLPWRGAFDMVPLPAMVPAVKRRRRVDGRSLADVVREVAA